MQKVMYLCDGEKEDCSKRICHKNGGVCMHTSDIQHAKNFNQKHPNQNSCFWEHQEE